MLFFKDVGDVTIFPSQTQSVSIHFLGLPINFEGVRELSSNKSLYKVR